MLDYICFNLLQKKNALGLHWCNMFVFFFFFCPMACGILVSQPGIKPGPLAVKVWCLNHWITRQYPRFFNINIKHGLFLNVLHFY